MYIMHKLDNTDERIIDVLRKNARLSLREIAKRSGVPSATVHKRMRGMEQDGTIRGYAAVLDKEKLGCGTVSYILVRSTPGADFDKMLKSINPHKAVEEMGAITGDFDVLIKIRVGSMKELDEFVMGFLRKVPEVTQTQTLLVFRQWER
jgi:Lrp/AsnC family leucine-responsive transcriptional regulator